MKIFTLPLRVGRRIRYTFLLINILGCISLFRAKAQSPLKADFSADTASGCSPVIVSFTDQSTGDPVSWNWDFGNGNKSTLQNPQTVYYKPGTYTVTLLIKDKDNNEQKVTRKSFITVADTPHVDYLAGPAVSGCYPLQVNFKDGSSPGSGSINSWLWDFGDGTISHQPNPSHVFTETGQFNITLSVTNSKGCSSTITDPAAIITNEAVKADFSADQSFSCTTPMQVRFKATAAHPDHLTYQWDFGDGTTGSGANPVHTFSKKGVYTVRLTASSVDGCTDTVIKKNYIHAGVYKTAFALPQGCAGAPVVFKNTSSPTPDSSLWDFGDGARIRKINATHTFEGPGTYVIKLINFYGSCKDTLTRSLTTYPSPKADFKANQELFCGLPVSVSFQDMSQSGASWSWNFGDGSFSSKKDPVHVYKKEGNFDVKLSLTNKEGCTDSIIKKDYIRISAPAVDFKAPVNSGCVGMKVHFENSVKSLEPIKSYHWNFGDDGTSTEANPTHTYHNEGTYTVKLKVVTASGCSDSLVKKAYIHVGEIPVVDFSATPQDACLETPVQFTNHSQPAGTSWRWEFPNDGHSTETGENPLHHFHNLGEQDVILTVNNNGCEQTATKENLINVQPPKAAFSAVHSCINRQEVTFSDKSTGAKNWHWDFGDGSTADIQNPSPHHYDHTGKYKVTLTVTNGVCTSRYNKMIYVIDEHPELKVDPDPVCHGSSIVLSATHLSDTSLIRSYTWLMGDGRTLNSNKPEIKTVYKQNGRYGAQLITTDLNGCKDTTAIDSITVRGPHAHFTLPVPTSCPGTQIDFTDKSSAAGSPIQSWVWDYGDGKRDTSDIGSVSHTYREGGQYNVRLTVTDENGCSNTRSRTQAVNIYFAKAAFATPDTLICPGAPIRWENKSSGNGMNYLWKFGDGTTSRDKTPDKTYQEEGTFTVSLQIQTQNGCIDSVQKEKYIHAAEPHAKLHYTDNNASCPPFIVSAVNQSIHYQKVSWDFGDGATATGKDTVKHVYNIPGNYRLRMLIYGYSGCMDSVIKNVYVAGPYGQATVTDSAGCSPHKVRFSANAVNTESYRWDFGDGVLSDASADHDISHLYKGAGIFRPKLILTDSRNCTVAIPIRESVTIDGIAAQPVYSIPDICDSGYIKFKTDGQIFSLDSLGQSADYLWDFDDPGSGKNTSTGPRPDHHYTDAGNYRPTLQIKTAYGCMARDTFELNVPVPRTLHITHSPDTAICAGETVPLYASGGYRYSWSPSASLDHPDKFNPVARPDKTTSYQLIAHDKNNCLADTSRILITVHDKPVVQLMPDTVIATGSSLRLQAASHSDITNWSWMPADYLSCTHCANPVSTPRRPITYRVVATNNFGCISTDDVKISLFCEKGNVFLPNTFTPNGDGMNDVFYPRGKGVKEVVYFRIYNRWGQLIYERTHFQINDRSAGWSGAFKGKPLPPGVFIYSSDMVCDDGKVFQVNGNITLIR